VGRFAFTEKAETESQQNELNSAPSFLACQNSCLSVLLPLVLLLPTLVAVVMCRIAAYYKSTECYLN
jgi:hypothetical protein